MPEILPKEYRLLVLGDSPTLPTGFARVLQNLLPHWREAFDGIDVWGIGYQGWPHELPYRIFPAQSYVHPHWFQEQNLQRFLSFLANGNYTHVFILQDTFHVATMAQALRDVCNRKNIHSLYYYPVDAPLDPEWIKAVLCVDTAVAYTEYGYAEVRKHKAAANLPKRILPHGTDLEVYRHCPEKKIEARGLFRDGRGKKVVGDDDFLIVNVNAHQKRKGLAQTLEVMSWLRGTVVLVPRGRLWLYMHMPPVNADEQSDLRNVALQLGLEDCVLFGEGSFRGSASLVSETHLRMIYTAADLLLTTTLGEGWGLTLTEAMACGLPVAGPGHTSVKELLDDPVKPRGLILPCNRRVVLPADNNRLRLVTDAPSAGERIGERIMQRGDSPDSFSTLAANALEWVRRPEYRWENIALEWLKLMELR